MKYAEVQEIIDCLPKERTLFRYFKDAYAPMLLQQWIRKGKTIADVKQSPLSGLLQKQIVKNLLAELGRAHIKSADLELAWETEVQNYLLTVGSWGQKKPDNYYQTSRSGYNLVLQLNFSNQHDLIYRQLVKPEKDQNFNYWAHPVLKRGRRSYYRETLAWARIDLDFSANESLIEEIQSDWVRHVEKSYQRAQKVLKFHYARGCNQRSCNCSVLDWYKRVVIYYEDVLLPYTRIWDEAMLAACIQFIKKELGIDNIFYHSYETGGTLKKCHPPRSLYSKLPRRFCFQSTPDAPEFLYQDRFFQRKYKKVPNKLWYKLPI